MTLPVITKLASNHSAQTEPCVDDAGAEPTVVAKPERALRVMTLNMAHGRGLSAHQAFLEASTIRSNLDDIATLLRVQQADVVALQEADGPSIWSGGFDHVERVANAANYGHRYRGNHSQWGAGRAKIDCGTALLSRDPLSDSSSHRFNLSWRDSKGFVHSTVTVPELENEPLGVVSVHLDFMRASIRRQQLGQLIETLNKSSNHVVVLGDLNCGWNSEEDCVRRLERELGLCAHSPANTAPTFPADHPLAPIDWVLLSPGLEFLSYRVLDDVVSDHRAIVADIALRSTASPNGKRRYETKEHSTLSRLAVGCLQPHRQPPVIPLRGFR